MYIRKELRKYIDDLASRKATPGGGSASALIGAIGIALNSMVANFTLDNDRYKRVHVRIREIYRKNELLRNDMQLLIDKDVIVFLKLQNILNASGDNMQKNTLLQKCLKDAANVPFEICTIARDAAKLTNEIARIGNVNLISDSGGAMYLLEAAFKSAELNVKINLKYMSDRRFVSKKKKDLKGMAEMISRLKKSVIKKTEGCL